MNEVKTLTEGKPIEWKGQRVITTALLAEVYGTDIDNVKKNFSRHKDNFVVGTHYFLLQGEDLREFKNKVTNSPLVNKTVISALGGKDSNAYKKIGRKVFAECNHDLKSYFNVNARNNIPKRRFDEAVEYAKNWKPCTNTQMLINDYNAQMTL